MAYTLVPTELIVDGAITSAKLDTNIAISGTLGVTGEVTLATHLIMGDNDKIKIGTGGDLEIYHDGSNSYISNSTGNIYLGDTNGAVHIQAKLNEESIICAADGAVTLYHDNSPKLATSSAGATVTGTLAATLSTAAQPNITSLGTLTGLTNSGDINFGDSDKAVFGAGSDLQIYHDGTNSYISDQGTNDLKVLATDFQLKNAADNEFMMTAVTDGAVTAYHNGLAKLATTSTGIDITGTATMDGLTVDGTFAFTSAVNGIINNPASCFINIDSDNNNAGEAFYISRDADNTTGARVAKFDATGDISFYDDTGVSQALFWDASAESLGIGTSSPAQKLHVFLGNAYVGAGNYFTDSTSGYFFGGNGSFTNGVYGVGINNMAFNVNGSERMRIDSSGNVGITVAASLRFNGVGDNTHAVGYDSTVDGSFIRGQNGIRILTGTGGGTERMRVNATGVKIGTGSPDGPLHIDAVTSNPILTVHKNSTGVSDAVRIRHGRALSGFFGKGIRFQRNDGTEVGSVVLRFTSTDFNTSSDYRLKENVNYTWDATTKLKQLKPARFNFIEEPTIEVDGFLAHEVQDIVPQAVSGEKDAVDDEGNPDYQGIDHSKLVPLLTKAIQEQQTIIDNLKTRIEALEG